MYYYQTWPTRAGNDETKCSTHFVQQTNFLKSLTTLVDFKKTHCHALVTRALHMGSNHLLTSPQDDALVIGCRGHEGGVDTEWPGSSVSPREAYHVSHRLSQHNTSHDNTSHHMTTHQNKSLSKSQKKQTKMSTVSHITPPGFRFGYDRVRGTGKDRGRDSVTCP